MRITPINSYSFKAQKGTFVQERTERKIDNITLKNGRAIGEDGIEYKGTFFTTNEQGDDVALRFWYDGSMSSSKVNGKMRKVFLTLLNGDKTVTRFLPDGREEKTRTTYQKNGFPLRSIRTVKTQFEEQPDGSLKKIDGYEILTTYYDNGRKNTVIKTIDGELKTCKQYDKETGNLKVIIP